MTSGLIFDIQRFSTHDGPGIRTTVFAKGCPLRCAWCHNPEGIFSELEIMFFPDKCIGCQACVTVCPAGAHRFPARGHIYNRAKCRRCGICAKHCPPRSLQLIGQAMTPEEIIRKVEKDRSFFEATGGGLTVSGGEPAMQHAFLLALLNKARQRHLHTCIETCGYGPASVFIALVPWTDLFLWDIKDTNESRHRRNTGAALAPILRNLRKVDAGGGKTILRCIALHRIHRGGAHWREIGGIYASLSNCQGVEILPYHPFGNAKRQQLGLSEPVAIADLEPAISEIQKVKKQLRQLGVKVL